MRSLFAGAAVAGALTLLQLQAVSAKLDRHADNQLEARSRHAIEGRRLKASAQQRIGHSVGVKGNGYATACPSTFRCSGSGKDGYHYDTQGHAAPQGYEGFLYFGV